jgi:hypothetical protein
MVAGQLALRGWETKKAGRRKASSGDEAVGVMRASDGDDDGEGRGRRAVSRWMDGGAMGAVALIYHPEHDAPDTLGSRVGRATE